MRSTRFVIWNVLNVLVFITFAALALYEVRLRTSPKPVTFQNARDALAAGRDADARRQFDDALRLRPNDPSVYESVISTCIAANKMDIAGDYARRAGDSARSASPDSKLKIYLIQSDAYSKIEHVPYQQDAVAAAKNALDLDPQSHMLQNAYAYLLVDNAQGKGQDVDTALAMLKKTLGDLKNGRMTAEDAQLGPEFVPEVEDSYGWALYKNGQYPDAITELSQALEDYPQTSGGEVLKVSQYHLGMAFLKAGQPDQARNAFNSALAYDPKYQEAIDGLAELNRQRKQPLSTPE